MRTHTRVAKIERIDRTLVADGIVRVRLADGCSIRMHKGIADLLLLTAGRVTTGLVAYSVDDAGNRYNPRPATDADREVAKAGS